MYKLPSMNKCFHLSIILWFLLPQHLQPCWDSMYNLLLMPQCTQQQSWWKTTQVFNLKVPKQQQQHSFSEQDCLQLPNNSSISGKAQSKDMSCRDTSISGAPSFCCDTSSFPRNNKFCGSSLYTETTRRLEDTWQQIDYLGSSLKICISNVLLKLAF